MTTKIPYVNLSKQWEKEREDLLPILDRVLASGQYVGGPSIAEFEENIKRVCGVKYAIALNSGTDALVCGLIALGIGSGDEVITPPNSFIASTAAIIQVGAKPVFVDVQADQNINIEMIEPAITDKTRAIMPIHLTGRVANMSAISSIAMKYDIYIIEDAAQSIGSLHEKKPAGSLGNIGCFSTHPLKNLNACGDGGFLTTNDQSIAEKIMLLRNHGLEDRNTVVHFGFVSRMDTLQAAILNYRVQNLSDVIEKRRENAELYQQLLNPKFVFHPPEKETEFNTYHTFVIQVKERDELQLYLEQEGIGTSIHYPIPIHLQPSSHFLGYKSSDFPITEEQSKHILSIPIHQYLSKNDIHTISKLINEFFEGKRFAS
jgi:dTDP-4-amino-4,6-dideoxygalactose transaminase